MIAPIEQRLRSVYAFLIDPRIDIGKVFFAVFQQQFLAFSLPIFCGNTCRSVWWNGTPGQRYRIFDHIVGG